MHRKRSVHSMQSASAACTACPARPTRRVHHHRHVRVVLGRGADHARPPNVNVLHSHLRRQERRPAHTSERRAARAHQVPTMQGQTQGSRRGTLIIQGANAGQQAWDATHSPSHPPTRPPARPPARPPTHPIRPPPTLPPARPHLEAGLAGGGDGLAEGVEVDHHHVNGRNAMLLDRRHVLRQVAPRQDAAVHARVQRLDAACGQEAQQRAPAGL